MYVDEVWSECVVILEQVMIYSYGTCVILHVCAINVGWA